MGITRKITLRAAPPLFVRQFEGSSVIDACRGEEIFGPEPACPRIPRKAPVPPVIVMLSRSMVDGDPGGGDPKFMPVAVMLPIGTPSPSNISHMKSSMLVRSTSAVAPPGGGADASRRNV